MSITASTKIEAVSKESPGLAPMVSNAACLSALSDSH
jgi:hypothetical protein